MFKIRSSQFYLMKTNTIRFSTKRKKKKRAFQDFFSSILAFSLYRLENKPKQNRKETRKSTEIIIYVSQLANWMYQATKRLSLQFGGK